MTDLEFFNHIAASWDENETMSLPPKVRSILSRLDIRPGMSVLDIGTGTGVLLPYLSELIGSDGKITAVDLSPEMLKIAKKKFQSLSPSPEFICCDIENESISGSFDRIILYCVFPHLHSPLATLKRLCNLHLRPGGTITIAFPTGSEAINNVHHERPIKSEPLLPAFELAEELSACGMRAEVVSDDNDAYILSITA